MKKIKNRTKFVVAAIANIIWFTVVVLVMSYQEKTVPDSLIQAWFAAWTVELALLAGIKIKGKDE